MAGSSDGEGRSPRLDRLNQEASVPADSANDFSVRAWLTSAKKCLDQVCHPLTSILTLLG